MRSLLQELGNFNIISRFDTNKDDAQEFILQEAIWA